jgi:TPR repeat protein
MLRLCKIWCASSVALLAVGCSTVDNTNKGDVHIAKKEVNGNAAEKKEMTPLIDKPVHVLKAASISNESPENLVILAEKAYNGISEEKDIVKALSLFIKAADKGSGYACRRLGLEYSDFAFDDKTPRDDKKARHWFEKGAAFGDADSMFFLSEFIFEGRGGPKDERRASELLVAAARANSHSAAHRAVKLSKRGSISLSPEDKSNFYVLDKRLRSINALR